MLHHCTYFLVAYFVDEIDSLSVPHVSHTSFPIDETISKEKIWQLIAQNEPTVVPISLVSTVSFSEDKINGHCEKNW